MKYLSKLMSLPFIIIIYFYKYVISPYTYRSCRYEPSCSTYALEAFKVHGPIKGVYLSTRRILSCNPWGGMGYDPVPDKRKKLDKK